MPRRVPTRTGPHPADPAGESAPRRSAPVAPGARARSLAAAALGGVAVAGAALVGLAAPAAAASASGPDGQQLTVSLATGLDPAGQTISVSGRGYDVSKGIYVALCVDNGARRAPSPCIGGVDMEGASGSSAWISSNPPAYGEGLAVPFDESGGSGSFAVDLSVRSADAFTDCLDPAVAPNGCVIGTRADHTRTGDRSADVRIPVTFDGGGAASGGDGAGAEGAGSNGSAAGTGADGLASTGVDAGAVVAAAGLLAAAGAGVLLATRRSVLARHAVVSQDGTSNPTSNPARPGA